MLGQNGGNGRSATSSGFATATMLPRLLIALATQLRQSHALPDAAPTLSRASEPWSLLFNRLAKTSPIQVKFGFCIAFDD